MGKQSIAHGVANVSSVVSYVYEIATITLLFYVANKTLAEANKKGNKL